MEATLSVDDLAAEAGLTVRTVRYYQAEGLLPPPARVGRTARYGAEHLERLQLITGLQERGLRLQAIRDVLDGRVAGTTADWLGLDDALKRPWSEDHAAILDQAAVGELVAGLPDGTLEALTAAGLVERRADSNPVVWFVPSAGMLEVGLDSVRLGIPVDTGAGLRKLLQARLSDLADELVAQFAENVAFTRLADAGPAALTDLLAHVQPLARRTVDLLFAQEMGRAQAELIEKEFGSD